MRKLLLPLILPVFAGCLTAHIPEVSRWNVRPETPASSSAKADFAAARLAQVVVVAPYDERTITVYRENDTLAEDPYNLFASSPSRLLREPARAILSSSGRFKAVVGSTSSANVSHIIELTVTNLRLDCSPDENGGERREAVTEVFALVMDDERNIVASARGAARADARNGNYGAAFSKSFSRALIDAVRAF